MSDLRSTIELLSQALKAALEQATNDEQLEAVRVEFLGRNGKIAALMPQLKELSAEEKREFGPLLNALKKDSETAFESKKDQVAEYKNAAVAVKKQHFDVTGIIPNQPHGTLHPYTYIQRTIENVFMTMGYQIADGPELEEEFYNFEALNIPGDHPARDMQDTIWLDLPSRLMRTHTSSVQIHTMQNNKPPLAIVASGRAYRHEATDATHDYVFMQTEGLLVGKDISMANLLATIKTFLGAIFEQDDIKLRVRPGYFPFVEPGIEVDIWWDGGATGKPRWLECMGAGLVHPNVFKHCGIDPKIYSGFAFGFGLTRLAMIKYGINDIRLFHNNSIEFLQQFS